MMASKSPSKQLQVEVTCPICLDYFTDPVILDCGHSFCQACIVRCWTFPGTSTACPQCRSAVGLDVRPNRLLANMGEIYRQMSWSATKDAQGRRAECEQHQFPLDHFCKDDGTPVCLLCYRSKEHTGHRVVPLGEVAQQHEAKDTKAKKRRRGKSPKKNCPIEAPWWSLETNGSDVAPLLEQVVTEEEEHNGKPEQNFPAAQPSELGHGGFPIHKKSKKKKRRQYYAKDDGTEGEGPSTLCSLNNSYDVCWIKEDPNHDPKVDEGKDMLFPPLGSTSSLVGLPDRSKDTLLGTAPTPASSLGRVLNEPAGEPIQNTPKEEHPDAWRLLPDLHLLPFNRSPPRRLLTSAFRLQGSENDLARRRTSYVWKYFTHLNGNKLLAVCGICRSRVRLGREGGCPKVGTSSMRRHIEYRHPQLVPKSISRAATTTSKGSRPIKNAAKPTKQLGVRRRLQSEDVPRKQKTIPETWGFKEKPPQDSDIVKSAKLNRALAMFVARSMLPLSIVEDEAFLAFMEELDPCWMVPRCPQLLNDLLPALEKEIKRELSKDLQGAAACTVHLTGSIWTNKQTRAYLCVAAHWISTAGASMERKNATLAVRLLSDLNQAPNVACELKSVVSEWLAPLALDVGCISTNSGSCILKAVQQSGVDPVPCIAHCLNLVLCRALKTAPSSVKDVLNLARTLSVHFRQSWAASEAIRVMQRRHALPERRFLLDASTNWESTLQMLARLCEQKLAVEDYVDDQGDLLGIRVQGAHWSAMQDLVDLLKLFSEFATIFKLERATFGKVLPMLQFLEVSVAKYGMEMAKKAGGSGQNPNPGVELAHHLLGQLRSSKHLASIRRDKRYLAATFLEPQIRCSVRAKLVNGVDRQFSALREYILQKCLHYHQKDCLVFLSGAERGTFEVASQTEGPAAVKQENSNEWECTGKVKSRYAKWLSDFGICTNDGGGDPAPAGDIQQLDAYGFVGRELDAYIRESFSGKVSCSENNPLLYWEAKMATWPSLAKVALWHLSCPSSSVASKRVFSTATNAAMKLRTSLTPRSVSTMAFIRANKSWLPKQGAPPPTNREADVTSEDCGGEDSEEEMALLEEDTDGEEERNGI